MVLMQDVFLVQPIHRAGTDRLQAAGFHVRQATGSDMATVAGEIGGAHAVVTRNAGLSAAAMAAAARLRLVVVHGVGHDPVDVSHATAHGSFHRASGQLEQISAHQAIPARQRGESSVKDRQVDRLQYGGCIRPIPERVERRTDT